MADPITEALLAQQFNRLPIPFNQPVYTDTSLPQSWASHVPRREDIRYVGDKTMAVDPYRTLSEEAGGLMNLHQGQIIHYPPFGGEYDDAVKQARERRRWGS